MSFNKRKFYEIVLTALVSGLLAFLQSLVSTNLGFDHETSTPFIASGIGATIRFIRA